MFSYSPEQSHRDALKALGATVSMVFSVDGLVYHAAGYDKQRYLAAWVDHRSRQVHWQLNPLIRVINTTLGVECNYSTVSPLCDLGNLVETLGYDRATTFETLTLLSHSGWDNGTTWREKAAALRSTLEHCAHLARFTDITPEQKLIFASLSTPVNEIREQLAADVPITLIAELGTKTRLVTAGA
jgi:hypothetical protein